MVTTGEFQRTSLTPKGLFLSGMGAAFSFEQVNSIVAVVWIKRWSQIPRGLCLSNCIYDVFCTLQVYTFNLL